MFSYTTSGNNILQTKNVSNGGIKLQKRQINEWNHKVKNGDGVRTFLFTTLVFFVLLSTTNFKVWTLKSGLHPIFRHLGLQLGLTFWLVDVTIQICSDTKQLKEIYALFPFYWDSKTSINNSNKPMNHSQDDFMFTRDNYNWTWLNFTRIQLQSVRFAITQVQSANFLLMQQLELSYLWCPHKNGLHFSMREFNLLDGV